MILVTSDQMRQFDKHTIHSRNVPGIVLMEHAGKAVADVVLQQGLDRVCVLCGKGNNGGDGWIAARWLKRRGTDVVVYSLVHPDSLAGDARTAFEMARAAGVPFQLAQSGTAGSPGSNEQQSIGRVDSGKLETDSATVEGQGTDVNVTPVPLADAYVDAMLGTGTTRPLTGPIKYVVDSVNARESCVVAVDVPSGVNGSTGQVFGVAIEADVTVSMGQQKLGTAVSPGCYHAGEVQVADIGIDVPESVQIEKLAAGIDVNWVRKHWPRRGASTHKGTFGRLAIAVGSMKGAPVLAGLGAARSGAGLVILASAIAVSEQAGGEAFQTPLEFVLRHSVGESSQLSDCTALVVGPGLGPSADDWTAIARNWNGFGVIDADALMPALQKGPVGSQWVLTPHPKECARLLGWTTQDVQQRRAEAAQMLAAQSGATVVLKGYHSLIASPDAPLLVNLTGNEALATAGTGDVLAGVIGGLLAQGISPRIAAAMGTWLHGRAGELAGETLSRVSVVASDVVEHISRAIRLHFDN